MLANSKILHILLVDDDEDDYLLLKDTLSRQAGEVGYPYIHLDWVSSYEEGLQALDARRHDAYLVDYRLGALSGTDLIAEARLRGVEEPIIILTGQGSYQVDVTAMQLGAADYLVKSQISLPLLERSIRYALTQSKVRNRLEELVREQTKELAQTVHSLESEVRLRKESEGRFRALTNTTSAAILIVRDRKIIYANPAARYVTGYSPEELTAMHLFDLMHPDYHTAAERSAQSGSWGADLPMRYEVKIVHKNGLERWLDITSGLLDYDGLPALIMTAFDITDRDLAEKALEQALDNLETEVAERTAELNRSAQMLLALEAAAAAVFAGLDAQDLPAQALSAAQAAIPAGRYAWLDLASGAGSRFEPSAGRGMPRSALDRPELPPEYDFRQRPPESRALRLDHANFTLPAAAGSPAEAVSIHSLITAPLLDGGGPVGVITLASDRAKAFSAFELDILERIAAACAPAVRRALSKKIP